MKLKVAATAVAFLLSTAVSAQQAKDAGETVLAKVNDFVITAKVYSEYASMRAPQLQGKFHPQLLEEMINRQLLLQEAARQKIAQREEVKAVVRFQSDSILASVAMNDHLQSVALDEAGLKKAYEERFAKTGTEYNARHILVDDEKLAESLIARIKKGEDFAALAKEHSKDGSAQQGGDLGWFDAAQMVTPFAEETRSLKKGEMSAKPVKTQFGWHVVQVMDTREAKAPEFEAVREELAKEIQGQQAQAYIEQLKSGAKIEYEN